MKQLLLIFVLSLGAAAQTGYTTIVPYSGAPSGSCKTSQLALNTTSGVFYNCSGGAWSSISSGFSGGSLATGSIIFVTSGTCPAGTTQAADLDGQMILATTAAHGDVGTTGGSATITPTVNALTAAAQAFTGSASQVTSATSGGTPAGTNATGTVTPTGTNAWPVGVPTNASGAFTDGAISWPAGVPTNAAITAGTPSGTISALTTGADSSTTGGVAKAIAQTPTFTGAALGTHTHTISWPAGVPTIAAGSFTQPTISWPAGVPAFSGSSSTTSAEVFTGSALATHTHTLTPAGTNGTSAVTGTMNSFDPHPSWTKAIPCRAN